MEKNKERPQSAIRYQILFDSKAHREFEKLNLADQRKISRHIDNLEINPKPQTKNFRPLKGYDLFRLRIGNVRIVYSIDEARKVVIIEKIGRRSEKFYKLI
ncbi:type II toxin-antitoxin system RelE/ParE family toxin [Candidatus Roizmanbacteria bacterium]|nr:type II toxin-antitoxin system RelE/ParE family toxin [Candidatus Roizmanbacteria bacterium]